MTISGQHMNTETNIFFCTFPCYQLDLVHIHQIESSGNLERFLDTFEATLDGEFLEADNDCYPSIINELRIKEQNPNKCSDTFSLREYYS